MERPARDKTAPERRTDRRSTVLVPAVMTVLSDAEATGIQGVIQNLSPGGALVCLSRGEEASLPGVLEQGEIGLRFRPPGLASTIHAACSVSRTGQRGDGIIELGLSLAVASEDERDSLAQYLSRPEPRRSRYPGGKTGRALIVDDDELYLMLLRGYLEDLGFEVADARDGRRAVKSFARNRADLIVLDILMPEKDGLEAIKEIRRLSPDVDVVAISSGLYGVYSPLATARAMGATRTLKKPFDRDMLYAVLLSLPRCIRCLSDIPPEAMSQKNG